MKWKYVQLDKFCDSVRDGTHDTPKKTDSGYKLITAKHINNDGIDFSEAYLISENDYNHINERSKVEKWDVLMSMIGNGLGKSFIVSEEPDYAIKNLALFKTGNEYKAKWLHYFLSSSFGQGIIYSKLQGTGQPFISLSFLRKMKIIIPSSEKEMIKIASILSTYDSLIENNTKRIRLLEQMAENLYKEWFVRFRFPGHENVEMENGLPKGWKVKKLFEVADVAYGYAFKSDKFCTDSNLNAVVRIRDIQDNHTGTYTDEVCDDKYLIKRNAILIGMDGIFHMCLWNGERAYLNQRVVMLNSKISDVCNYLLYFSIRPQIKYWEQVIAGTTVAHLGDKHLRRVKVLVPGQDILRKANKILEEAMNEINHLQHQNKYLTRQRDLLLPRLMSGKLEVTV